MANKQMNIGNSSSQIDFNVTGSISLNGKNLSTSPTIYSGTSEPASSLGENGDIYIKITE